MSITKYGIYSPNIKNEFATHFDYLLDSFMNYNFPTLTEKVDDDFFKKGTFPKVNVYSDNSAFFIQAAVAGYHKDDITVKVKDNLLTISGNSNFNSKLKDAKFYFREVKLSNFSRTFKLNDFLDSEKISAKVEDGLLSVSIPYKAKPKENQEKVIYIK